MPDLSPADLIAATDQLFTDKMPWEAQWREVQQYMLPDGPDFNQQDVPGARRRDLIVSNYGESQLEDAADGLVGLACAAGTRWKGLTVAGLHKDAHAERVWLEAANERMLAVYDNPRSRFIPGIKALALEWLGFGTAGLFLVGRPGAVPIFEQRPLAELAGAEGADGFIDQVAWRFEWSARKAFQKWGDALPARIKEAAADPRKANQRFKFAHYVYPRLDYDRGKRDARARPYRECWLALDEKALIAEDGYFSFPYIVGRLGKRGGWDYGRGRGAKALAEVKMLQRVRRTTIQGAEKVINPPLQGPDDAVMGDVDLRPGMYNAVRPEWLARGAGITPIMTGARPDIGMDFEESVKQDIGGPLLRKVLNLPREPRMLVDQVLALEEEAMRAAGPIVGEFQTEILGPMDARLFDIMQRAMAFQDLGPAPGRVAGRELLPDFESPAARARNLGIVRAIGNRNQIMAPIWQQQPELLDLHDWEATDRMVGEVLGIPAQLYKSPEQFKAALDARNQAAQEQQQLEGIKDLTTGLKNAAPALKIATENGQQVAA